MITKGCVGWVGSVFLFLDKNFLFLLWVPLVGSWCLVWGFGAGRGGLFEGEVGAWLLGHIRPGDRSYSLFSGQMRLAGSSLPLAFCLSRMPCLGLGLWINFGSPGERLGASLRTSLMLCNYIKCQNC